MEKLVDKPAARRRLLLQATRAALGASSARQLADAALEPMRLAVDASFVMLFHTRTSFAYELFVSPDRADLAAISETYSALAANDPCHAVKVRTNPDVAVLTDMIERTTLSRSAVGTVYRSMEGEHVLVFRVGATPFGQAGAAGIMFGRAAHQHVFDRETIEELRSIRPLIESAYERNERAVAAETVARACSGAVFALAPDGRVAWMSREAEQLLRGVVSSDVRDAARRLAAIFDDSTDVPPSNAQMIVPIPGPRPLEAHLVPSRAYPGAPPMILVRVATAPSSAWVKRLPPRLRRVLDLLDTGASEKEIADRAGLSYASAHQYIVQIYRRANVSSRAGLMVQLGAARK